ncbi:MAG TPA: AMP-binding protein, partial [Gallionella sp.]|nr:AMP-binding protein [Gallionella sp.]
MSNIQSVLNETRVFPPSDEFVKQANVSGMASYQALCAEAERDYQGFWGRLARENIAWKQPFEKILNDSNAPFYKWFEDGQLNVSHNCLDRHLATQPEKTAIIFEADDGTVSKVSYRELHGRVSQFANGLKSRGIKKGDRVVIYLPMSIEAIVAMQACARIGAIHSVVFGGFSSKSLHERIVDAQACAVITADAQMRGGKVMPLKTIVDEALAQEGCDCVRNVIVYRRAGSSVDWNDERDIWWHDLFNAQPTHCEPEWVDAEHPLFILYTSGSTGKPKGVQHSS